MSVIQIKKLNEIHMRVESDGFTEKELAKYFSFPKPEFRFLKPEQRIGKDPVYHLYYTDAKRLYVGLLPRLKRFAEEHNHTLEIDEESFKTEMERESGTSEPFTMDVPAMNDPVTGEYLESETHTMEDTEKDFPADEEEFLEWLYGLEIQYEPAAWIGETEMNRPRLTAIREHQAKTMLDILKRQRGIILFPHSEDKFPFICCLLRWLLERNKKCLFVVRTKAVTDNLYENFEKSFPKERNAGSFYMTDHTQKIYTGLTNEVSKPVVLASWQSIHKQPREWFEQFNVVFMDEVDKFNQVPLVDIMKQTLNARLRIGFADTLENTKTHELNLEGLFGSSVVCEAPETAEKHHDLDITFFRLKYPNDVKEAGKEGKRAEEIKIIQQHEKRNQFICDKACELKGNTLVLFEKVEQGNILCELIREKVERDELNQEVFFSTGPVGEKDEEELRANIGKNPGCIIVASYGRTNTGFRIPYLNNIIFGSPYKNNIRNLRDIGGGLVPSGKHCNLYDIADDMGIGNRKNHLMKEAEKRLKGYNAENLNVKIEDVHIDG